ncbi:MAG: EMC3/TMCO1 family protein [Candidatus Bathyarchaeia archaeon]
MIDLFSNLATLDLSVLQQPPLSTLFILGLSMAISVVTSLSNRMVIDMEEFRSWTIESAHVRQELMEAMRSGNQRRIAKAQKKQQQMMATQQKMTMDRMKIMLFFFIPFILIWQVLGNFFKGIDYIALMPFEAPLIAPQGTLSISTWYIFCSISTNIIVSRILGLTFEIEPKEE